MHITDMNSGASDAVRAELAAIGTSRSHLQQHQRKGRAAVVLAAVVVVAGATTGAALLANAQPGATTTAPLGRITTATGTGPALIDLGPVPKLAGSVIVTLTCLDDEGTVLVPTVAQAGSDGGSDGITCSKRGSRPIAVRDARLPAGGSTTISIESSPNTRWRATAQYASSTTADWGLNAKGQTYGVSNRSGDPDLTAVTATNGQKGYAVTKKMFEFDTTRTLEVYESDGTTVIGHLDLTIVPNLPDSQTMVPDQVESPTPMP